MEMINEGKEENRNGNRCREQRKIMRSESEIEEKCERER